MQRFRKLLLVLTFLTCTLLPTAVLATNAGDLQAANDDTNFYDPNADCATTDSGGGTANPGDNNATVAYAYFVSKGLPPAAAAGIVGNMIEESGVAPERLQATPLNQVTTPDQVVSQGLVNAGGVGWGIVQWTPPSDIITSSSPSPSVGTLYYQLGFLWNELNKSYASVISQLKSDTSPVQAATDFLNGFEKGDASPDRQLDAQAIYSFEVNHTPIPSSVLGNIASGAAANPGNPSDAPSTVASTGGADDCSVGTGLTGNCANPLRGVKYSGGAILPLRVDQGVDYEGTGPIYPVCDATIVLAESDAAAGWPGDGDFIAYTVNGNSIDGKTLPAGTVIYFSEDCVATVKQGDSVTTQQPICNMNEGGTNIETGWSTKSILTSALGHTDPCWNGGSATNYGQNFSALIKALGGPPGDLTRSSGVCTTPLPSNWPTW
jgi:hypothetical protein